MSKQPALSRWNRFPSTPFLWACLLALTALGAFLRFWRIGYQCYWTDEASTVARICGSFDYLLARLSTQGFPPGWYAALRWWCLAIENYTRSGSFAFSPAATRSLPALLGTLTVPAMYFLARQFTDRKGALLVALLTAVNPFLIYYSRDIKMYSAMWLFVALNMAVFFKWQTTHKHLLWFPLFVLTGFLMTAMQSMAWFIIALQLLFLLTRPRLKSLDGPLWLTGVGLISLLPVYWYTYRTQWLTSVVDQNSDGGLSWITRYTDMSWKTLASLPCSHLLGYLWPVYPSSPPTEPTLNIGHLLLHPFAPAAALTGDKADWARLQDWFELGDSDFNRHLATRSWHWMADAQLYVAIAFLAILLLGLIPWRGIRRSPERIQSVTRRRWWWVAAWILIPSTALALTWIPDTSPWHNWLWQSFTPPAIWEPRYLGMIVPAWLLWMAASLRRLPTWPLRTLAITFVTAACTFSSLSNHLILRNPPFNRIAEIAKRYYDPQKKLSLAIGNPSTPYAMPVEQVTFHLAAGERPTPEQEPFIPEEHWRYSLYSPAECLAFLTEMRSTPAVKTIILTDRYGDLTEPKEILSNESLAKRLGPRWKLDAEERYPWHYEWRCYIFHTWRTRVWTRITPTTTKRPP